MATPDSLYLKLEAIDLGNKDINIVDIILVLYGDGYIGGDYYFDIKNIR